METQTASGTRISSDGIRIGTATKMISNASSTNAATKMAPRIAAVAVVSTAWQGGHPALDQLVGAEQAQTKVKVVAASSGEKSVPVVAMLSVSIGPSELQRDTGG